MCSWFCIKFSKELSGHCNNKSCRSVLRKKVVRVYYLFSLSFSTLLFGSLFSSGYYSQNGNSLYPLNQLLKSRFDIEDQECKKAFTVYGSSEVGSALQTQFDLSEFSPIHFTSVFRGLKLCHSCSNCKVDVEQEEAEGQRSYRLLWFLTAVLVWSSVTLQLFVPSKKQKR